LRMRSISPTDVPPNFMTIRAIKYLAVSFRVEAAYIGRNRRYA
jgi:hypothetical protein